MKGSFITGTDTGVGKTLVAANLAKILANRGFDLAVRKPVESGCATKDGRLFPEDAFCLQQAAQSKESLNRICPHRYAAALSPARAAILEKRPLNLNRLVEACSVEPSKFLIVEGAGGFYSPIARDGLNADLAASLELPVLIVADNRLGTINQVLLVLEAVQRRGLTPLGIVLNRLRAELNPKLQNRAELQHWTSTPILEVPFLAPGTLQNVSRLFSPIVDWISETGLGP